VVRLFGICDRTDNLLLFPAEQKSPSINLSKVTKLKYVTFQSASQGAGWITATLKTIPKHRDLHVVKIYLPSYTLTAGDVDNARQVFGEANWREWLDLDHLLVEFWESSSLRPRVACPMRAMGRSGTRHCVGCRCLLPEITRRGIIDLVNSSLCY
jgi:hypothetical protein